MNTMKWLIKREFWEHKGAFVWTPLVVGAITFCLGAMTLLNAPLHMIPDADVKHISGVVMGMTIFPMLVVIYCVSLFYLAGTMYEERKDRSVLFWKSLPISDTATVLSKAATALIVAPALAYAIAIGFGYLILIVYVVVQASGGQFNVSLLFDNRDLVQIPLFVLGSIPVYALWALPTAGVLLLVSAWARSSPLRWVVSLPLVLGVGVTWLNHSFGFTDNMAWYWRDIVSRGFMSNVPFSWFVLNPNFSLDSLRSPQGWGDVLKTFSSWRQLTTLNLWIGVAAGSAMIYAAIRIRRWKDEG
jgi:ABC-2 type transport system permease protein